MRKGVAAADLAAETELVHRRWQIAKLRLDWELLRFAIGGREALYRSKYNPNQPRVPAGVREGGQWTGEGAPGTPTRLAGEPPDIGHNHPPAGGKSPVPKIKPSKRDARMAIVNGLARLGRPLAKLILIAPWLREYAAEIRSYQDPTKTLEELQEAVSDLPKPGYQKHHIVEQAAARDANFPEDQIQNSDNLVAVPTQRHRLITGWYARANDDPPFNGLSPREYLQDKSWEERRRLGLQKLIDFGVMKP